MERSSATALRHRLTRLPPSCVAAMHDESKPSPSSGLGPDCDPFLGTTIAGKYAIEARLGRGAMGAVYRARQLALDKSVAIKILHRELAVEPTFVARFRREAKAASRLDHPNSIRVFDFGEEANGVLYLAMEYVAGRDLYSFAAEFGPLSPAAIVELLSQVLAVLSVAHSIGVLHRDLKPENIMIVRTQGDDGQPLDVVKVCDFGIAKILGPPEKEGGPDSPGRRTTAGMVVGTPEYMSPEQARGLPLDGRSDLYSTGVILYELLAGHVPFEGAGPLDVVLKHVSDNPVPPSSRAAGVNPKLEAICLTAMQKQPVDRFQNAREMRDALRDALRDAVGSAPTPSGPRTFGPLTAFAEPTSESRSKPTLDGVAPLTSTPVRRRARSWYALALVPVAAAVVILQMRRESPDLPPVASPASTALALPAPPVTTSQLDPAPVPLAVEAMVAPPPMAKTRSAPVVRPPSEAKPRHAVVETKAPIAAPEPAESPPVPTAAGVVAAPVVETATPAPVPAPPPVAAPAPPPADLAPRAFDPAAAHVEIGQATRTAGATPSSITRTVSEAGSQLTRCYRASLSPASVPFEGRARMHVETDGAGVITDVRITGLADAAAADCMVAAVRGRRIPNVDTGSASADVPLVLRAH